MNESIRFHLEAGERPAIGLAMYRLYDLSGRPCRRCRIQTICAPAGKPMAYRTSVSTQPTKYVRVDRLIDVQRQQYEAY
jgi:hypothetical protein